MIQQEITEIDFIVDFLVWYGSFCSFSFGFCCSLSNREAIEVAAFLSLFEGHLFRCGRRGVKIWSLNALEGSCISLSIVVWLILLLWEC